MLQRLPTAATMQRARGFGRLSVAHKRGATRIADLYQQGCAKLRVPDPRGRGLEAVMINTSGGLTGGDRMEWQFDVGANAALTVTTQACERLYAATEGNASIDVSLTVAEGGSLFWLPQETILFDRSALTRRLSVDLAEGAEALLVEAIIFGRHLMGEAVEHLSLRDRWRIRRDGKLIHAEDLFFAGDTQPFPNPALLAGAGAMATLVLIAPRTEALLADARIAAGETGGASLIDDRLIVRLVAADGFALRARLTRLINLMSGGGALPKVWSL